MATEDLAPASISPFVSRHIGPREDDHQGMLATIGVGSTAELIDRTVPELIRLRESMDLPAGLSEDAALAKLRGYAKRNVLKTSMIGLGYSNCRTPHVITRNILENPAWYTAYTPYQPEISQGRLEALLNFQTVIEDLTGLPIASSSLLDEPTAAAEAMTLTHRASKKSSDVFIVDADSHPQTIEVIRTRALPIGIEVRVLDVDTLSAEVVESAYGVLISYPSTTGRIRDLTPVAELANANSTLMVVAADLLALTLLAAPGAIGADVVVGSAQRFGVPLGFGGPHAGYMSVRSGLERMMPGRLVGVSIDSHSNPGLRLALQTREQHIRREKATSNICTAQVLLAVVAGMYAAWHGPDGLKAIARTVNRHARAIAAAATAAGFTVVHADFFDTVLIRCVGQADGVVSAALAQDINIRKIDADHVVIATDECTEQSHVQQLVSAFAAVAANGDASFAAAISAAADGNSAPSIAPQLQRTTPFLQHPVFNTYRSETQLLRYLRRLSDKDIALDRSMIPLGSCTMKLNATAEMMPITWPEFASIH
ncbi:MAG: glycine dehydrogenase (aminomethyl-transferring), partial [Actinobacteria bacterium]|nr:glycine dehydrogenase (aminomethyl-transferring) [Actinomycetota bacterium]